MATAKTSKKHHKKQKRATLAHHHAKPYRKRHFLALSFFTVLALVVAYFGAQILVHNSNARFDANNTTADQLKSQSAKSQPITVRSTLGFELTYDPDIFTTSATVVDQAGKTKNYDYTADTPARDYSLVQFVPDKLGSKVDKSTLSVYAPQDKTVTQAELGSIAQNYVDRTGDSFNVVTTKTETVTINGSEYLKTSFDSVPKPKLSKTTLPTIHTTVYVGLLKNNKPLILQVSNLIDEVSPQASYDALIQTTTQTNSTVALAKSIGVKLSQTVSGLFGQSTVPNPSLKSNSDIFGNQAQASAVPDSSSRIANEYTPATVKVYNVTCSSISYNGYTVADNTCYGGTGSGFIISADGYIGTNGHVAVMSVKNGVINAIKDPKILYKFLIATGESTADAMDFVDKAQINPNYLLVINALILKMPESAFTESSKDQIYAIALGKDPIDIMDWVKNGNFKETESIKKVKLVGYDYDPTDEYSLMGAYRKSQIDEPGKFTHSDVAILKAEGANFPVTKLGTIDSLTSGSPLTIIGYPGVSDMSVLTDNKKLEATVTKGTVSAIRDSNGAGKKLIQSDATGSHGNSGGPAFDESGKVVGLLTYGSQQIQDGDGNYAYLRDVKDLKDLAKDKSISLNTDSKTQKVWSQGLDEFYNAHFHAAISKFEEAKKIYPALAQADTMITVANTKIANGEEASDPLLTVLLIGVGVLALGGIVYMVMVISKHRVKHAIYTTTNAGKTPLANVPAMVGASTAGPTVGAFGQPSMPMGPVAPGTIPPTSVAPSAPSAQATPPQPPSRLL